MIKFTIPLPPVTKKNSQRILINKFTGKPFIAPSKQYKAYEEAALWFVPKNKNIDKPVNIKCLFYMPTHRKCDLTNLLEAIDDILVKARLLADDNYTVIYSHDGSRVFYDKQNPRTEVYITPVELSELEITRAYIHDNNLQYDLLAYTRKKEEEKADFLTKTLNLQK